ncbi:peroxisomal adenine nucleotide carrier [Pycnococcus provasolii]
MASQLIEACAGATGALVSTWALYPIDTLKTRLQAELGGSGALSYFDKRLYAGLFNGIGMKSVQIVASSFTFFYTYEHLKALVEKRSTGKARKMSATTNVAIATLAGMVNVLVTMPLDTIATRYQCRDNKASSASEKKKDDSATNGTSVEKEKDGALYRGLLISLFLSINPGVNFTVFEQLKRHHQERLRVKLGRPPGRSPPQLSAKASFVLGALAKCIATLTTYPAIRTKVLLQGPGGHRYKGSNDLERAIDAFRQVLHFEGVTGLYKGAQPQLLKTVFAAALMLMIKEKISAAQKMALRQLTASKQ